MHVRRTDHTELAKSHRKYTTDEEFFEWIDCALPPDSIVYLSTDNRNTQIAFKKKYGKRIRWWQDIPEKTHSLRHTSLVHAAIDLYMCISSDAFKGSGYSSFTDYILEMKKNR